jgi:HK97 family phage portal protein
MGTVGGMMAGPMKLFGFHISRSVRNELIPAEPADSEVLPLGQVSPAYWARMFGDGGGSGERIAAVYACVYVIASSIAAMPLQLYRRDGTSRKREKTHRLAGFLDDAPNGAMTWPQLREAMLYQLVLRGNAYTRNFWRGGHVGEMFPLPQDVVEPKLTDARRLGYEVRENSAKVPPGLFFVPDLAHFKGMSADGLTGISPIEHCRMTMRAATAITEHGTTTAEKGAPLRGIVTNAPPMRNDEAAKNARARLSSAVAEAGRGDGVAIFEGDLKFTPVSMSMRDAQFIESMRFSVEEIARIFNVPPHKIQMLERATFNNIEHLSREFYSAALLPWITRIESTLNACLLTKGDREAGIYLRHNADGLLRGDLATRAEAYTKQIGSGILTPNEARAMEERDAIEGGDNAFFPVNLAPLTSASSLKPPAPEPDDS